MLVFSTEVVLTTHCVC